MRYNLQKQAFVIESSTRFVGHAKSSLFFLLKKSFASEVFANISGRIFNGHTKLMMVFNLKSYCTIVTRTILRKGTTMLCNSQGRQKTGTWTTKSIMKHQYDCCSCSIQGILVIYFLLTNHDVTMSVRESVTATAIN